MDRFAPQKVELLSAVILTVALTATLFFLIRLTRTSRVPLIRIISAATTLLLVTLSPWLCELLIYHMNRTGGITRIMIDPGWPFKVAPALIAMLIVVLLNLKSVVTTLHD